MASKPMIKLGVLAAIGAAAVAVTTAVAAPSEAASGPAPVTSGARYLALGDSIAFGYRDSHAINPPNYTKPGTLTGYPTVVAKDLGLKVTNATCPGETTASFIKAGDRDNGCTVAADGTTPGYRTHFPLHTTYASDTQSQLQFARAFLKAHPDTKLVTLQIGANDGLRCFAHHKCQDAQGLAILAAHIQHRLNIILNRLINEGGYKGQLVLVNYYSVNSASATANGQSVLLNNAEKAVADNYSNVTIANSYTPFANASKNAAGSDTCTAGLEAFLTVTGQNENCDIHPSLAGTALIASAVERVVKKS